MEENSGVAAALTAPDASSSLWNQVDQDLIGVFSDGAVPFADDEEVELAKLAAAEARAFTLEDDANSALRKLPLSRPDFRESGPIPAMPSPKSSGDSSAAATASAIGAALAPKAIVGAAPAVAAIAAAPTAAAAEGQEDVEEEDEEELKPAAATPLPASSPRPATRLRRRCSRRSGPTPLVLNASQCEYAVVREVALEMGWDVCETKFSPGSSDGLRKDPTAAEDPNLTADAAYVCTHAGQCNRLWSVMWHDHPSFGDHFRGLLPFQKFSHLPGLAFFARKAGLATLMSRMHRLHPAEYRFYPRTWILPLEMSEFQGEFSGRGGVSPHAFILKPDAGCQGRGIFMTKRLEDVQILEKAVAQRYLSRPLLIEGYKFDLRLYVLITSVDPLRFFLFNDGLVRMCTEPYQPPTKANLDRACMHLTNYSVNKNSKNFVSDDSGETGFKRSVRWLRRWLDDEGHDSPAIWARLADACAKTVITVSPKLRREYRCWNTSAAGPASTCFTIVGMDLMLDEDLEPWIIEINHLPSFRTDTKMDHRIKKKLVQDALNLLNVQPGDRERWQRDMQRRTREKLLGLPPKPERERSRSPRPNSTAGGFWSGGADGGGGGGGGGSDRQKDRERERMLELEAYEQGAKGGFERLYPPSRTCPNPHADYQPMMRAAENVFAQLAGFGPLATPRTAQPGP
ncbi:unnamed protein product, partial [Phaeothamnion confervicola]